MTIQATEEMPSSDVRDIIFSQHVTLRGLLDALVEAAELALSSQERLDDLRARAQTLYDALATHMAFEEEVLPSALRDVIGWGAVIQLKLEEDHVRQRQILAEAIFAVGPGGLPGAELVQNVRFFARTLLIDMESEEKSLLQADLDAAAIDSKGG